jgi:DNA invertase Pin-like site-specific DNA recombinase
MGEKNKAIILARVSTEDQKEAGNSLPAQQRRLEDYAKNKGFDIEKTYSFDETAYKSERKSFNEMVQSLKDRQETVILCCDKIDRLIRTLQQN